MSKNERFTPVFSVVRLILYPFALIYGAIVWLRNRMYDTGFFKGIEFSVPVISVGNLSTGGTGKTPHIEYLIKLLQYQYKVATMSRGYKRHTQGFLLAEPGTNALKIGDEPMQYFMKFPDVVVSVAEERMTGIPSLLQRRPDVDVILLDDAYQHRSVKAGLNILITDHSKPFYKDFILPYGGLREGRKAYQRADVIIVSKCAPNLSKHDADEVTRRINPLENQEVFFSTIGYQQPYELFTGQPVSLQGKNAVLVCCIAKPEPLIAMAKSMANDVHVLSYADHHYFYNRDMEEIKATLDNWDVKDKVIITTEKDATRLHLQLEKLKDWNIPLVVMPINVEILFGKAAQFDRKVHRTASFIGSVLLRFYNMLPAL